jgi:hypothetical protein
MCNTFVVVVYVLQLQVFRGLSSSKMLLVEYQILGCSCGGRDRCWIQEMHLLSDCRSATENFDNRIGKAKIIVSSMTYLVRPKNKRVSPAVPASSLLDSTNLRMLRKMRLETILSAIQHSFQLPHSWGHAHLRRSKENITPASTCNSI